MIFRIGSFFSFILILFQKCKAEPNIEGGTPCYDYLGRAQRCIPQFENAAFGLQIEATSTCGEHGPTEYCSFSKTCEFCYSRAEHDAHYMTDHNSQNITWWQSETMHEGIQYPNSVNLTLRFGKAFDITFIHLKFYSPRPHSFAIYKKTTEDGPHVPYQYFSTDCMGMYNVPNENYVRRGEPETKALCTSEFSDFIPLSGGNVPFSTLEGRPSALKFDYLPEFWDWVSATEIKVTLNKLNTFGDDIFGQTKDLKQYFYAISDFDVGARCKCNGHASECYKSYTDDGRVKRVCRCEHKTAGPDCNQCLPFYNDAPWRRASKESAYECQPCNCNGFSNRCIFDAELFKRTGHGGRCLECSGNRDGPNCDSCRQNYYLPVYTNSTVCEPCNCNEIGSLSLQCNREGKCICKVGVTGQKCDRCDANYYEFGIHGCKECRCNEAGSYKNQPSCHPETGVCNCKDNVEGKQCNSCKLGHFNLDYYNEFGCTPCFCYGHASTCQSAPGYSKGLIESTFIRGIDKWDAKELGGRNVPIVHNGVTQALEVTAPLAEFVYFIANDKFLGDQRASYNHILSFKLRIGDSMPIPSVEDIILEGGGGLKISQTIFGQGNRIPTTVFQEYKFHLHEHPEYGWQPRITTRDFISILTNLTSIRIRATYSVEGFGSIDDVSLETARPGTTGFPANWIELCKCPDGYIGQFCESCAPGRRHEPTVEGSFAPCVPCDCNKHATICDAETGRCRCEDHTAGHNCEKCAQGYYGNALLGNADDCKPCPCPNRGACIQYGDGDDISSVICLACPTGYGGQHCEICSDGYYGDPNGEFGRQTTCQACDCNLNVDPNAIGNCNRTTGECLKCIYNTGGSHCDRCLPGYFGDALSLIKGDCKPCQCYSVGTLEHDSGVLLCDQYSGQCQCKVNVIGTNCDQCAPGYFNIISGQGCESCQCDSVGSLNNTCDIISGQCHCRPGVTGTRCDKCAPNHYGFSIEGCRACNCDNIGSSSLQCDSSGQCSCMDNVEGRTCDRCKENKYNRERNCVDCPPCYNLVKDAVDSHRSDLRAIEEAIHNITESAIVITDEDFELKMKQTFARIDKLLNDVQAATVGAGGGRTVSGKLGELYKQLEEINALSQAISNWTRAAKSAVGDAESNITMAEQTIQHSQKAIQDAIDYMQTDGVGALTKAKAKSAEVGQQSEQMSEIVKEARALVQSLEEKSDSVRAVADKALNVSLESYEKAKDTINRQKNITNELKHLNSTLLFIGERLNSTIDQANDVKQKVLSAYEEALSIFTDIYALNVPSIDTASINSNSTAILKTANDLSNEIDEILKSNADLVESVKTLTAEANHLLKQVFAQQQIADELLADADGANSKAEEAVRLGEKTLREAQETHKTIKEFDKQVQDSKDKSQESIKQIPSIQKQLTDVRNKTKMAEDALAGAETNAQNARAIAQEAEREYINVASNATEVLKKTNMIKSEADDLQKRTNDLSGRVNATAEKVDELGKRSQADQAVIITAKEKVSQAKSNAADAKNQVEKAAAEISAIIKELNDLHDIDENSLTELSNRLQAAQKMYENSKIDEELETLNRVRLTQSQQIKSYQEELDHLRQEAENVDDIRKALPDGCWKRSRLEP